MPDLYSDILLDHYRLPRYRGRLTDPTVSAEGLNPLCGDELVLDLRFDGDRLVEISFDGKGCAISTASASMLTEAVQGKTMAELEVWIAAVRDFLRDGEPPTTVDLGDIEALAGVSKLPVRVKCASLPWTTLETCLADYRAK
ncbi:SUF system NifU family Fe-S cluster assembly protein [candidate division KSB1 bacterium]|nr:SUF system NifU family Fe-S cluster assembly protein [candidate division KSB1 bacterium]